MTFNTMKLKKLLAAGLICGSAAMPIAAEAQYVNGWSSGSYFGGGNVMPRTQTYQRGNGWSSGDYFGFPRSNRSSGSSYGGSGINYGRLGVRDCSKYISC